MPDVADIAANIIQCAGNAPRVLVAIAGPPGAGKSTIAERLCRAFPAGSAMVVPMDGFHFDDMVLHQRGLRALKGAPETFDFRGFATLLQRLREGEQGVAIPIFDRSLELSRAGAAIVDVDVKFILIEGNYLLLDEEPWSGLRSLFDYAIFIEVPLDELRRRLVERWHSHGKSDEEGRAWIESNDMPNIERVLARRRSADMVVSQAVAERSAEPGSLAVR